MKGERSKRREKKVDGHGVTGITSYFSHELQREKPRRRMNDLSASFWGNERNKSCLWDVFIKIYIKTQNHWIQE